MSNRLSKKKATRCINMMKAKLVGYDKADKAYIIQIKTSLLSQIFTVVAQTIYFRKDRRENAKTLICEEMHSSYYFEELKNKPIMVDKLEIGEFGEEVYLVITEEEE